MKPGPSAAATLAIGAHRREVVLWASPSMGDVEADIACALRCDLNVMITGEPGLGKKSLARRIHRRSRRGAPRAIECSQGAVDWAESLTRALLDAMPGGIVQIEDAERMPPALQSQLLEFLERQTIEGFAGRSFVHGTSVRFVTVAGTSLFDLVGSGQFCESLLYRLNAIHLIIPPLRDRPEDIPVLLHHFLTLHARTSVPRLSQSALQRLVTYKWPGNIRELRTVAETLVSRHLDRVYEPDDLPPDLRCVNCR
jgi:DNA-binding NtrC family response regulator